MLRTELICGGQTSNVIRNTGRRIVELQTSLALVHAPPGPEPLMHDQFEREPFQHPALEGLNGFSENCKNRFLDKKRMAKLAESYGLDGVVRWKPKNVRYLLVLPHTNVSIADSICRRGT